MVTRVLGQRRKLHTKKGPDKVEVSSKVLVIDFKYLFFLTE